MVLTGLMAVKSIFLKVFMTAQSIRRLFTLATVAGSKKTLSLPVVLLEGTTALPTNLETLDVASKTLAPRTIMDDLLMTMVVVFMLWFG